MRTQSNPTLSLSLGRWSNSPKEIIVIGNDKDDAKNKITINNLKYCLLSKGINFNVDAKYFERNNYVYKGKIEDISQELFNDSIMFSLFYHSNYFSNRGQRNYIMPFTAEELGCNVNDLNVLVGYIDENGKEIDMNDKKLFNQNKETLKKVEFDFRKWFHQFNFSQEAMDLYNTALEIFRWYHSTGNYVNNGFQRSMWQDFNDGFKDITNGVMRYDYNNNSGIGGHTNNLSFLTRTSKGTTGFGRNTIKKVVPPEILPIFINFFDTRDILARKINKQLVDSGLLLWERENIY